METVIPEFGIRRENEERRDGGCGVVFDPKRQRYAVGERTEDGLLILFSGGVDANEDIEKGILREVAEESGLYDFVHVEKVARAFTHYRNLAKKVNRVALATCFLAVLRSDARMPLKLEAHEKFVLVWKTAGEILENWRSRNQTKDYDHWIYFLESGVRRVKELGYDTASM